MSAQTSYDIIHPIAYAGLLFAQAPSDVVSRSIETVAGAAFGLAVGRGTADTQVVIGGDATFVGITVRSLDKEGAANTGAIQYDEKDTAAVLRSGYVWAVCPAGCIPGNLVFYTDVDGVLDAGVAAAGETQLANAQWTTTASAGELAVIRIGA